MGGKLNFLVCPSANAEFGTAKVAAMATPNIVFAKHSSAPLARNSFSVTTLLPLDPEITDDRPTDAGLTTNAHEPLWQNKITKTIKPRGDIADI